NRKRVSFVQRVEAGLRLAALEGKTSSRQHSGHIVGVGRQNLLVIFAGFGKVSGILIEAGQGGLYVGIIGRCFGKVLVSFYRFFFSSRRRHTRWPRDWSSDVCSSD